MRFKCRKVDDAFLDKAPELIVNSVDLSRSAAAVFAILADAEAWPRWFESMRRVEWTSPPPLGPGATRTVYLNSVTADEYFYAWEPDRRFAFCFTAVSRPFAAAFAEDYSLEPLAEGCRFTWRVGYQPAWFLKPFAGFLRADFEEMFAKATADFAEYVKNTRV